MQQKRNQVGGLLLRNSRFLLLEEGTWAAWLHDLLLPHVTRVMVCDPRRNALLRAGNHNDRVDARKLAELLYLNELSPVYHGEHGLRTLKEVSRSANLRYYLTVFDGWLLTFRQAISSYA